MVMPVWTNGGNTNTGLVGGGWKWLGLSGLLTFSALAWGAEDDYLRQLELEASKVDGGGATTVQPTEQGDIKEFERELQSRYRGSFLFYEKLSPVSRAEIHAEYRGGASIDDLRKKIMKRFLRKK